jgi:hypothetical protein
LGRSEEEKEATGAYRRPQELLARGDMRGIGPD